MGGDLRTGNVNVDTIKFQSTPPYGGRPEMILPMAVLFQFQSTPPYGGRLSDFFSLVSASVFQSTPPYGGRRLGLPCGLVRGGECFNPRPRMGGDDDGYRNGLLIQTKSPYLREPNDTTTGTRLRAWRLGPIVKQIHQLAGCANLPEKKCLLGVRAPSEHERPIGIVCRFAADMLDP